MDFNIKENSLLAFIACKIRKCSSIAMVLGNTIHLNAVDKSSFLNDKKWLAHELVHIRQFRQYGFWKFLWMYLIESIRKGYYNNRFEVEARREAESESANSNR